MKLLIDQNISNRLVAVIASAFPDCMHVKTLGLMDADDEDIFSYAVQNGFIAILTLDADFFNIMQRRGVPPKIIWVRTGNVSTSFLGKLLLERAEKITLFIADPNFQCFEIYK